MTPATQRVALGPTGNAVAENMKRIRVARGLSLRDVAELLEECGHTIAHSGLSKIENRTRRVDVDDLIAIALVLDVSPVGLLFPEALHPQEVVRTSAGRAEAAETWEWMIGERPHPNAPVLHGFDTHLPDPGAHAERQRFFRRYAAPWWWAMDANHD